MSSNTKLGRLLAAALAALAIGASAAWASQGADDPPGDDRGGQVATHHDAGDDNPGHRGRHRGRGGDDGPRHHAGDDRRGGHGEQEPGDDHGGHGGLEPWDDHGGGDSGLED